MPNVKQAFLPYYSTGASGTSGWSGTGPSGTGWFNINVLALVQHFQVSHASIANFLVMNSTESDATNYCGFYASSSNATDTTLRPKLVITYVRVPRYGFVNHQNPGVV